VSERFIIIHSLADARIALAAASKLDRAVTLVSAPGAGLYGGPGWFKALLDLAGADAAWAVLDCADAPGQVLAAWRAGLRRVGFSGDEAAAIALADIAAQLGVRLERMPLAPTLDLSRAADPAAACCEFLASGDGSAPGRR
jgi:hypothetical protein